MHLDDVEIQKFKNSNSFLTFHYLGEDYLERTVYEDAKQAIKNRISLTVAGQSERKQMHGRIEKPIPN